MNKINIALLFCTIYIILFKIKIHNYFCFFFLCSSKTCCSTRFGGFQVSQPASPPLDVGSFVNEHITVLGAERRNCVVCLKRERKQFKVQTYCKAPQCKQYMYVASDKKIRAGKRGVNRGQQIRRSVLIFCKIRQSTGIFTKILIRSTVREVSTQEHSVT